MVNLPLSEKINNLQTILKQQKLSKENQQLLLQELQRLKKEKQKKKY
jgi:hypothetical protein